MAYAIKKGSDYFDTALTTGTGSGGSVTGINFSPDFVWTKNRNYTYTHGLVNSVVGGDKLLQSSATAAEATSAQYIQSFNSDGFTFGNSPIYADNTRTYVHWMWRGSDSAAVTNTDGSITSQVSANPTSKFSIVTWTGNGSNGATIGHGLGNAPEWIIVKRRDSSGDDWLHYHTSLGATKSIAFDTNAAITSSTRWNNTTPSSTVITLGTSTGVNGSGATYVAYCFAEVEGFSKFGSYTGNGVTDGTFVYTGFRPAFLLTKRTDTAGNWILTDTRRSPDNESHETLYANLSNAEAGMGKDLLSNGFKCKTSDADINASGGTYIYMAFAETPLKYANAR